MRNRDVWRGFCGCLNSCKSHDQLFHDVLELEATYKTKRFGMPLILFTGIDKNGLTILIGGCLVSDQRFESYSWCIRKFKQILKFDPDVVFTDGDYEVVRAIQE